MRRGQSGTLPAERMVFFTDAVVAIAMTLLILPLLESVTEAARAGEGALGYAREHDGQIFAFALSFLIIGLFWRGHDRMFERVARQDRWLFLLNLLWMFTIVSLPVTTAMVGAMETDAPQLAMYIGTLLASSVLSLGMNLRLLGAPGLAKDGQAPGREMLPASIATAVLFAVALLLALVVPGLQFWSLLVLLLRLPLDWLLRRLRGHASTSDAAASTPSSTSVTTRWHNPGAKPRRASAPASRR